MDTQGISHRPYKELGDLLKESLKRKGRSESWLARQLGISPAAVSQYCSGEKRPQTLFLALIAEWFNLDLDGLLEAGHYGGSQRERAKTVYSASFSSKLDDIGEKLDWICQIHLGGKPSMAVDLVGKIWRDLDIIKQRRLPYFSRGDEEQFSRLCALADHRYTGAAIDMLPQKELEVLEPYPDNILEIAEKIGDRSLKNVSHYFAAALKFQQKKYRQSLEGLKEVTTAYGPEEIVLLARRTRLLAHGYLNDKEAFKRELKDKETQQIIDRGLSNNSSWIPLMYETRGRVQGKFGIVNEAQKSLEEAQKIYDGQSPGHKYRYVGVEIKHTQLVVALETPDKRDINFIQKVAGEARILAREHNCRRIEQDIDHILLELEARSRRDKAVRQVSIPAEP